VVPLLLASAWLMPWDWSSSDWSGLTFLAVIVGAYVAWRQVSEARRLREEQARPFVVIDFHAVANFFIEVRITNLGTTLAYDAQFKFDRPPTSTHEDRNLANLNLFRNGIPSLAPGKEFVFFFDTYPDRIEKDLPMSYEVHVTYTDPSGKGYSDRAVLDLDIYYDSGGITQHGLHDVHKQLKRIADNLKNWTDPDGLKVLTRDDLRTRRAERVADRAARTASTQDTGPENDSPA